MFGVKSEEVDQLRGGVDLCLDHRLTLKHMEHSAEFGEQHICFIVIVSLSDGKCLIMGCFMLFFSGLFTLHWDFSICVCVCVCLYLSDHGLGEDLCSLGATDDIGCLEEDLGSVLDGLQVPFFPRRHRRQDGFVNQLLC